jgi:hypothetical protein
MSSKQKNNKVSPANSARAEHITTANDRPRGDRGSAMGPRILQLLHARRLSFSLTLLVICLLLGAVRPAHAQAQALNRNTASAQLHLQVYLVPVTRAQLEVAQLKPQLPSEPVSYEMKTNVPSRQDTIVTTAPMPPVISPSDRPAVVETVTVVPR